MKKIGFSLLAAMTAMCAVAAPRFDDSPAQASEWGARPAEGEVCAETPPAFVWRPQKGARSYDLQYARTAEFAGAVCVTGLTRNVCRPTETLASGRWFWRVRAHFAKAPTDWTAPRAFTVAPDARACPLPPKDAILARIPEGHPRLFARPETRAVYLAGLKTTYAEPWKRLQAMCRRVLKNPPSTEEPRPYTADELRAKHPEAWKRKWVSDYKRVLYLTQAMSELAFRWWIDRDAASGALARKILMEILPWDPKGASGYRLNDEAGMPYYVHVSRTYTFLNDLLSEEERAACRRVIRVRGQEMFRHLYPRILWAPFASHSQRAWHFLGEGAVACYGEIPEARTWLEHVLDTYACVYPVWGDDDGGWQEGTGYWNSYTGRFMRWSDVMRIDLGVNAFEKAYYAHAGDYILYQEIPGGRGPGFADCANGTRAEMFAEQMRVLAANAGNPHWQWYAETAARGKLPLVVSYVAFARASQTPPTARPPVDVPQSKLFRGVGLAAMNKTLLAASNNVQVLFKCAPRFGSTSHGYDANNSFNLNAFGERLFVHSGERDCYGSVFHRDWMWHTKSCNCVTAGGVSQQRHDFRNTGAIAAFRTSPELDVVTGVLGDRYEDGNVTNFTRTVYFRKAFPEAVLVVDRLAAKAPTTFEWHLHTPTGPFAIAGQHAVSARGACASAEVDFLWPEGLALAQTDAFDPPIGHGYKLVEHHLTATTPQPATTALFVTLLAPYRTGTETPPKATCTRGPQGLRVSWPVQGASPWVVDVPDPAER